MLRISRPPPSAENEEWKELTAPVEVPVVEVANTEEVNGPNRTSFPSMDPPAAWSAAPWWVSSATVTPVSTSAHRMPIAARIAQP